MTDGDPSPPHLVFLTLLNKEKNSCGMAQDASPYPHKSVPIRRMTPALNPGLPAAIPPVSCYPVLHVRMLEK
jgi:hypothetical protein